MSTLSTISIAHVIHKEGLDDFPVSAGYDKIRFLRRVMLGDTVTVHYKVAAVDKRAAAASPTGRPSISTTRSWPWAGT